MNSSAGLVKTFFSDALKAIAEARSCIFIAMVLYGCAIFVGWAYADNLSFLEEQLKRLAAQFAEKNAITFIFKIFLHNLIATYVAMCFVILFGVVPTIIAVFNGIILGWIIATSAGMTEANIWMLIIPHGIFEWPAMIVAWGIGLWRGGGYRFSDTSGTWKERWETAHKVFFTVVLPLLFIAAIIEGRYHIFNEVSGIWSNP
jgi:uncharacterized membrane protein SpoIIM required for sporulation